jgi:hypothetical protein
MHRLDDFAKRRELKGERAIRVQGK